MATIPDWMARLAADLLREYSDRLSNDGCNDYDVPEYVDRKELVALLDAWDGDDEEPDKASDLCGYNWAVVGAVAHALHPRDPD